MYDETVCLLLRGDSTADTDNPQTAAAAARLDTECMDASDVQYFLDFWSVVNVIEKTTE